MHGFIEFNNNAAQPTLPVKKNNLSEPLKLIEITRDSPAAHIEALVGKDAVHRAGSQSAEELIHYRLGGAAFNRSCFAVINDNEAVEPQSAIYVHKVYEPITTPRDLPGNVGDILSSAAVPMSGATPTAFIFYSITSFGNRKGAGEVLLRNVHGNLTTTYPGAVLSTLSPLRQPVNGKPGIDDALPPEWELLDDASRRAIVLSYLLTKSEGVQRFHMGNGAVIGDIKLDADSVGRHRVMANYIYSPDMAQLTTNAEAFRNAVGGADMMPFVSPFLADEARRSAFVQQRGLGFAAGIAPA